VAEPDDAFSQALSQTLLVPLVALVVLIAAVSESCGSTPSSAGSTRR